MAPVIIRRVAKSKRNYLALVLVVVASRFDDDEHEN